MKNIKSLLVVLTVCAALLLTGCLTGCQVFKYESPTGEKLSRTSFGSKTSASSVAITAGPNGERILKITGYKSDQVEALGVVAEKASYGTAKALTGK